MTHAAARALARVRVRFAPSPTGHLHLGGLRTALFNALYARKMGGTMVLRIEDTDQNRLVPGAADMLVAALRWAGVTIDEGPGATGAGAHGPYVQSERLGLYDAHAATLMEGGHAYRCFCTSDRLAAVRKLASKVGSSTAYDGACREMHPDQAAEKMAAGVPHTIRLRAPREGSTTVDDLVYGTVKFENASVDDQVLMKSNGFPTYHLANVVDDHLMDITHVLRGEEWLSSAAKHVLLYRAFGWQEPKFVSRARRGAARAARGPRAPAHARATTAAAAAAAAAAH